MATTEDLQIRLQEVLELAAEWLKKMDTLLPSSALEAQSRWQAPGPSAVEDKVVAEIATLVHIASRPRLGKSASSSTDAAWERAIQALAKRGRPERHRALLARAPHVVWPVGLTHAILHRYGHIDHEFDILLTQCLKSRWNQGVDRPLFRAMETRWANAVYSTGRPDVQDLLLSAPLEDVIPALLARRDDAYALTHTLFYATDFGAYALPEWINTAAIADRLDAYLAWQVHDRDLDLVGELLAAARCGLLPSRYAKSAFDAVWSEIRSGVTRGPFAEGWTRDADPLDPIIFGSCYHTTLVVGILCATLLAEPLNSLPPGDVAAANAMALDGELIRGYRSGCAQTMTSALDSASQGGIRTSTMTALGEALTIRSLSDQPRVHQLAQDTHQSTFV